MNRLAYMIFLFVLIFSPLAFGTVERWSLAIMETLSILALLFLFLGNKREALYEIPGILPLILFLGYILLQLVPLPAGIVKLISPSTYSLYNETIGIIEPVEWMSISINKKATLAEFFRFAAYVGFYVMTIQLLTNKELLKKTVTIVIVFATLLSIFALLQDTLVKDKAGWFRNLKHIGIPFVPFGSFIYHNNYAAFIEMIFPLSLGLFFYYKPSVHYQSFRERVSELFNQQRTSIYVLLAFSAILMGTSIFVSLSRGGVISLSLSTFFLVFMLLIKGKVKRQSGILFLMVIILMLVSVEWFGWDGILKRIKIGKTSHECSIIWRVVVYNDTVNIIRDFPLTGAGFGTWSQIYQGYRTVPGTFRYRNAHNDYLELLANGGIIPFLLAAWFFITFFFKSYKAFRKRRESYSICLYLGSIAGIVAILIHSHGDWILQNGANGLYFFFLFGLAVSAANTRLREGLGETKLRKIRFSWLKILGVPVVIVLVGCLVFNVGALIGQLYFAPVRKAYEKEDISRDGVIKLNGEAYKAARYDPLEAKYYFTSANAEALLSNDSAALNHYKKTLQLNPVNGEYLQRFGLFMSGCGDNDVADKLLQTGIKYDRNNPKRYEIYASWLFSQDKKEAGKEYLKLAMAIDPEKTGEFIILMRLCGLGDQDIQGALPERVKAHLVFGDYVYKKGNDKMAEEAYMNALQHIKNEEIIRPWFFYKVYGYYMKKGRYEEALKVMQKAIDVLPKDAKVRLTMAALYEKLGITYRAREEYQKALTLDPGNQKAKKRLGELVS